MRTEALFLVILTTVVSALANPDYAFDVWVSGTNVSYAFAHRPAAIDEVKSRMKQVAVIAPDLAVHLIVDERSSLGTISNVCSMANDCGLTNVVVDVFEKAAAVPMELGIRGMNITVEHIRTDELEKTEAVQPAVRRDGKPEPQR